MGSDVQRILQMFNANKTEIFTSEGFAMGFVVLPVNLATGQHLAKPQLLSGPAAMAAHKLLMNINLKKKVRSTSAIDSIPGDARALLLSASGPSTVCMHGSNSSCQHTCVD
jgi:hypothetical protein